MRLSACAAFDEGTLEADVLNLLLVDIDGGLRSVSLPRAYVSADTFRYGIGFDASNYGFAKVEQSDMVAIPDCNAAWIEERDGSTIAHVLCDVISTERRDFDQYPRSVARRAAAYLRETGIADSAQMLVELEFYAFDTVEYGSGPSHAYYAIGSREGLGKAHDAQRRFDPLAGYHRLPPDDRFFDFRNRVVGTMLEAGIPVKYHHHEVGASQLEIELDFIELSRAADSICIAKWIVRSVAETMGLQVTFMPKPLYKMPGSGMHVHQFLEKDGRNLFPGEGLYGLSKVGLAYTAGLLEHSLTGSLLAFTNPSTNSFRRLVPGYEAPLGATFAEGSRSAAVRVPGYLRRDELRIEYRTGDASANPHYSLAAMALAGVDGILRGADPVALGFDRIEACEDRLFPLSLHAVLDGLEDDRAWLEPAFPARLLELWIGRKRADAAYVYNAPTPQEYELYF